MNNLSQFLQNSPLIILGMFIITSLSGVISILVGWRRFRDDILLKGVTIPVYVYLIILFFIGSAIIYWPAIENRPRPLRTIEGESFGVQRIIVDGKKFINCKFNKTELVFKGESDLSIVGCSLTNVSYTFSGPAERTLKILKTLYKTPEFRPMIDNTFEAIRKDKLKQAITPSSAAND